MATVKAWGRTNVPWASRTCDPGRIPCRSLCRWCLRTPALALGSQYPGRPRPRLGVRRHHLSTAQRPETKKCQPWDSNPRGAKGELRRAHRPDWYLEPKWLRSKHGDAQTRHGQAGRVPQVISRRTWHLMQKCFRDHKYGCERNFRRVKIPN